MASYKELAEKYGSKLKEACVFEEHTPGRRRIAQMLAEWSGERVSQYAARKVMEHLDLAKGEHTGRVKTFNRIDDTSYYRGLIITGPTLPDYLHGQSL